MQLPVDRDLLLPTSLSLLLSRKVPGDRAAACMALGGKGTLAPRQSLGVCELVPSEEGWWCLL